jgi:hypothetical protein
MRPEEARLEVSRYTYRHSSLKPARLLKPEVSQFELRPTFARRQRGESLADRL